MNSELAFLPTTSVLRKGVEVAAGSPSHVAIGRIVRAESSC